MSTDTTLAICSTGSEETELFGERVGRNLKGGEVIELVSDLGGGKTTFVRGLAHGLGSTDHVSSPTFTLAREYSVKGATFHKLVHFDFYRLQDAGLAKHELAEFIDDPENVVVIEWAEVVKDVLPKDRLTITIIATSDNDRNVTFRYPAKLKYLMDNVC